MAGEHTWREDRESLSKRRTLSVSYSQHLLWLDDSEMESRTTLVSMSRTELYNLCGSPTLAGSLSHTHAHTHCFSTLNLLGTGSWMERWTSPRSRIIWAKNGSLSRWLFITFETNGSIDFSSEWVLTCVAEKPLNTKCMQCNISTRKRVDLNCKI